MNEHKVKKILKLWITNQTLLNHVNTPLQPSLLISISEVRFDATRVAPKQTFFQIPLYPRFANTSLLDTSSMVILCLRGMFCNCSKSRGISLWPHLPFFWLATTTGMLWASWVLPRFHKRWTDLMCTPNWWATIVVSFLGCHSCF